MTEPKSKAIRLNKLLAQHGLCSRREADRWIEEGRVSVDGVVERELGVSVDPESQRVAVDGVELTSQPEKVYIALYKPQGVVTTRKDPQHRKTVLDCLPPEIAGAGVFPCGRLDADSEGLLLLTNDGDWNQTMLHPSHEIWKEYQVTLDRAPKPNELKRLEEGVRVEGRKTLPARISAPNPRNPLEFTIAIREGRNRQIRKMCGVLRLNVKRLKRIQVGQIKLGKLKPGEWRPLNKIEIASIS